MADEQLPGSELELWAGFGHDPRDPAAAGLRASNADRDRVHGVLAQAYADGRLDRAEFDERTDAVARARTLGELPPAVHDLLPQTPSAPVTPTSVAERAAAAYLSDRRQASWAFLSASAVCWLIWLLTDRGFPWPAFVMLGTGLNLARVVVMRRDLIAEEVSRLERREAKRQVRDAKRRGELPGGSA